MKNKLMILGTLLIAGVGIFSGLAVGKTPPGQDPCSHGNTGKPCRPDPQPSHGKDCLHHGKKGGVNEDHCVGTTTTSTDTSTTVQTVTRPGQTVTLTPGPSQTTPQPLPAPIAKAKAKAKAVEKAHILKRVIVSRHVPKTAG